MEYVSVPLLNPNQLFSYYNFFTSFAIITKSLQSLTLEVSLLILQQELWLLSYISLVYCPLTKSFMEFVKLYSKTPFVPVICFRTKLTRLDRELTWVLEVRLIVCSSLPNRPILPLVKPHARYSIGNKGLFGLGVSSGHMI